MQHDEPVIQSVQDSSLAIVDMTNSSDEHFKVLPRHDMIQKLGKEVTLKLLVLIQAHDRYIVVSVLMCINCTDTNRQGVEQKRVNAWVMSRA